MRSYQTNSVFDDVIEKVLIIAVKTAIESVPVVGPVFFVLSVFSDIKKLGKTYK